jgi:transcriptional regulator
VFVPNSHDPPDPSWVTEHLRRYPLAILVTSQPDGYPIATHVPTILGSADGDGSPDGSLRGLSILGHMNRQNPHWDGIQSGGPVLLIYHGANGYVSPTVYQTSPAAPTWDFTSVHVRGRLAVLPEEETLGVIKRTVRTFEASHGTGWEMTGSLGYFDRLLPGVGAFRVTAEKADAMFKLSQEQRADTRELVAKSFEADGWSDRKELARLIRKAIKPPAVT